MSAPDDDAPPPRSPAAAVPPGWVLTCLLGTLTAVAPLSIDMYLPALPSLTRDLHAHASTTQLTLTACLVGLAVGQLVAGPASDVRGRRSPLLVGLVLYVVASLACAVAPNVWVLVAMRFVQGATGAAGVVVARAVVRDLHAGAAAARAFSLLLLVNGLAPILAPIVGGQLLHVTNWRGTFVTLAAIGAVTTAVTAALLPETLPLERRRPRERGDLARAASTLLGDRRFVAYAAAVGLPFAAMFAYISGSPFVLQTMHGLSPAQFSFAFATNALGIVAASQVNGVLVARVGAHRMLGAGLAIALVGAALLLVATLADWGLAGLLPALFLVVAPIGIVMPCGTALALDDHPDIAGSASALLGVGQYLVGGVAAPLVGVAGEHTAVPLAVVVGVLVVLANVVPRLLLGRAAVA